MHVVVVLRDEGWQRVYGPFADEAAARAFGLRVSEQIATDVWAFACPLQVRYPDSASAIRFALGKEH